MNLFGVGVLELAVIFLIAFLVMGPGKTIEMARTAGKLLGDVRRTVNEITAAADLTKDLSKDLSDVGRPTASSTSTTESTTEAAPKPPEPPPTGAVPTSGPGDGNEQQPRTDAD